MREVPSILFGFMREMLDDAGLDTGAAAEGLRLARKKPRVGTRVDWDELATFLNRASAGLSDDEIERIGERYVHTNRYFSALLALVSRPATFYRIMWAGSRHAFPHIEFDVEKHGRSELRLGMTMAPSFTGCRFFFLGTAGELRALPRLLDLPDAEVSVEAGSHHARYRVRLGESERLWARLKRGGDTGREMLAEHMLGLFASSTTAPGGRGAGTVRELQKQYGLTRAEARVAARLGQGMTVADIASDLAVTVETVRTHLKRSYAKTGVRRQAELVRLVLGVSDDE